MDKLFSILALFRKGNAVADPQLWKNGGITVAMLIPVFLAFPRVAEAFGFVLPITESDAATISAAVLCLGHVVLTVTTSKTVGLPAKPAPIPPASPARFGNGTA